MANDAISDGLRRRDLLKAGFLAGAGLTLSNYCGLARAGRLERTPTARAGILIRLAGGPSHLDTFDMKPNAPDEYRGPFKPIKTNVPGVEFCEHLPKLAQCADKFAILRGVTHTLGAHQQAAEYVNPGISPLDSGRSHKALDIGEESPAFAAPFGQDPFGASCLLACRQIEFGARFVTVSQGGWDTHHANFTKLRESLLPQLDTGLSALLNGLDQKGLFESTGVLVTGEFGRSPKISDRCVKGGRDHHPRCMFMLMAGGGISGGQVVGESDDTGSLPAADGYSPDDALASFRHNLGIGYTEECFTSTGAPSAIVRDGNVIRELFS